MSNPLSIFVPINKIDEEQRLVYGQVAAEVMDNSGEMFDYEGSKDYFAKWSDNAYETSGGKSYGNVRVMHTAKVAGIVSSPLGFNDDAKTIEACAKVIDDAEWEMVKAGGYTGFSMGGRYVSRATKSDGVKTYIADPCEISLVDKPCIPTATFEVVKADGITEDRRFRDDLYQKSDAGGTMYVPTNDEMLPVAKSLAKAAGKTDADWLEFMDAAREDLIAKHDAGGAPQSETPAENADAPAQADEGGDVEKGDKPFGDDKDKDEEEASDEDKGEAADGGDEGGASGASEDEEDEDKKGEAAAKADTPETPELEQGWKAKDGTFFVKKADALAHNETLAKGTAEPSLADRLANAVAKADQVINGEVEEPVVLVVKTATLDALAQPLAKMRGFMEDPLVKSMYDVRQLADIVSSLDCLHCSLAYESAWREDESALPADVFDHLKSLGATLVALAANEVKHIVASAAKTAAGTTGEAVIEVVFDEPVLELAASTLGLEKSALLPEVETLAKADTGTLAKIDAGSGDALAKMDALEKRATAAEETAAKATEELAKIAPLVASMEERLTKMAAMPRDKAPTTRVVEKGQDVNGGTGEFSLAKMAEQNPNIVIDAAIRAAQQHGRTIGQ